MLFYLIRLLPKLRFAVLLPIIVFAAEDLSAESQADLNALIGTWTTAIIGFPGDPQYATLKVEQTGDHLTGTISTEIGEAKLNNIAVEGPNHVFNFRLEMFNKPMPFRISIRVEGDIFKGDFPFVTSTTKDGFRGAKAGSPSEATLKKDIQEILMKSVGAPTLPASDAKQFLGEWVLRWESSMGGQTEVQCAISDVDGKAIAKLTRPVPWGSSTVTQIKKTANGLNLNYTMDLVGTKMVSSLDLERHGGFITGQLDVARGQVQSPVEGVRKGRTLAKMSAEGEIVFVEYGQPRRNPPKAWEHSVAPLGADETATLRTEVDLHFGGQSIKAGGYTLWLNRSGDAPTLIFADWSASKVEAVMKGVPEIPLTTAKIDAPAVKFRIEIKQDRDALEIGSLRIALGNQEYNAKFTMKIPPPPEPTIAKTGTATTTEITILRTPNEGIQPQAVAEADGTIHLVYFKGETDKGDLFYVRMKPGEAKFSDPIRVNSQDGSATSTGAMRNAQVALGKGGRLHVGWNGSYIAQTKGPEGADPFLYARMNDQRTGFEPERNLATSTRGLDGGGSIAADAEGNVYAVWHAKGNQAGEAFRAVYIARSSDDGGTFAPEKQANPNPTGACGCCGLRAFADAKGNLYIFYRAAGEGVHRDNTLLVSRDHGATFTDAKIDEWKTGTCPMSSYFLSESDSKIFASWETKGEVHYGLVETAGKGIKPIIAPAEPGTSRKHPVVVANAKGEKLMVWTEGTGRRNGDPFCWQLYDANDKPTVKAGRKSGLPVWGLVAAVAKPDGNFVILY